MLVHALDPVDEFLVENYLVEGIIALGDIAVLYGAPKTGKSFIARSTLQRCCIGRERTLTA